jgi:ABC-type nitrate/sulfonate/bicarbonate transport system ATPase subunit
MLKVEGVSKSFGNKLVLENLHLEVNEGEFVSILGPSGSGKSTLLHLIGGLYTPDQGTIRLQGEVVNGKSGKVSYMPQQPSLFPWRTVLQNVMLAQEIIGRPNQKIAQQMLEKAGLGDVIHNYPHQLSGGMKQRVAFIRALLSPHPFICLDEPFSALDEFTRYEMQMWLREILKEHQRTILLITHNIDEAILLSDRLYIFTNRPATVKKEIHVPFPQPREQELMLTEPFMEVKKEVYEQLRTELKTGDSVETSY